MLTSCLVRSSSEFACSSKTVLFLVIYLHQFIPGRGGSSRRNNTIHTATHYSVIFLYFKWQTSSGYPSMRLGCLYALLSSLCSSCSLLCSLRSINCSNTLIISKVRQNDVLTKFKKQILLNNTGPLGPFPIQFTQPKQQFQYKSNTNKNLKYFV